MSSCKVEIFLLMCLSLLIKPQLKERRREGETKYVWGIFITVVTHFYQEYLPNMDPRWIGSLLYIEDKLFHFLKDINLFHLIELSYARFMGVLTQWAVVT